MTDHSKLALERPEAYSGSVHLVGEDAPRSVADAATHLDLPPLIRRFRQWAIAEDSLVCLVLQYSIDQKRLHESDWVEHMSEKTWIDIADFRTAFEAAKRYFEIVGEHPN